MGETTGSVWIGAFRDAVVGCGVACCDTVLEGIVGVTTDPIRGEACRDAIVGGIVDVTTDPCHGEAFCDAVLGGTVGVTTGP